MPSARYAAAVQDASPIPQTRIRWKLYQLAVMLVPGVIFLATYPELYRKELLRAQEALPADPHFNSQPEYSAFIAGTGCGFVMLMAMLLCAALVSLDQPRRRQTIKKALYAFGLMTAMNVIVCSGGCTLGNHQTQDLQQTVRDLWQARPQLENGTTLP